jgi:TolA-binding protein
LAARQEVDVRWLAQSQLWRTQLVTCTSEDIAQWESAIQQMPQPLRAGPYYLLGQARSRHRQHDAAALAFLRVPIAYPACYSLAAEGLLAAAAELRMAGHTGEAESLDRELQNRYGDTDAAAARAAVEPTQ